jgi:hypothetical protein
LVRVFNPSNGQAFVRVVGMSGSGVYLEQRYALAGHAALEVLLPLPHHATSHTPIGVVVSCSTACAATAMLGVHPGIGTAQPVSPEVWGETLN